MPIVYTDAAPVDSSFAVASCKHLAFKTSAPTPIWVRFQQSAELYAILHALRQLILRSYTHACLIVDNAAAYHSVVSGRVSSSCFDRFDRSPLLTNLLLQSSKLTSSVYHSRHVAAMSAYSRRLSRWPRSVIQRYPLSRPPGGLVRAPLFDSNQRPAARGSSSIFWIRQNPYTRPPSQWSCTASSCSHSSICSASLSSPLSNHATSVANLLPSGLQNVMAASTGVPYPLPSSAGPVTTENTDLPLKLPTSRALNSNTTSANSYATSAEIWHEFCLPEVLPSHQPSIVPQVSYFQHIPNQLFRVLQPTSPKQSHG